MAFKIGKVASAKINVTALVPDGEIIREEKMQVGIKIFTNTEAVRLKQTLLDAGSRDVDGDFLKNHAVTSVDGVQFDDGQSLSVQEVIDIPYLRSAIETAYSLTAAGVKRKN